MIPHLPEHNAPYTVVPLGIIFYIELVQMAYSPSFVDFTKKCTQVQSLPFLG